MDKEHPSMNKKKKNPDNFLSETFKYSQKVDLEGLYIPLSFICLTRAI